MLRDDGLARVESAFLSAAIEPCLWGAAMEAVAREAGAQACGLFLGDGRAAPLAFTPSEKEMVEYYVREGWHLRDERAHMLPIMRARGVTVDFDCFDEETILRRPYYQEFLGRFDYRWFAGVEIKTAVDTYTMGILRKNAVGPFLAEEQADLALWGRRLSSAATFAGALNLARATGACDALEALGMPALLLGAKGEVCRANANAERLFCRDFGVRNRRLAIANKAAFDALDAALRRVLGRHTSDATAGPVTVPREGRRPLALTVISLERHNANPFAQAAALLLIVDLDARRAPDARHLRELFALTAAEAELTRRLARGESLETAAEHLRVAGETARKRLKSVFEKTGTHKQGALIALVGRMTKTATL